MSGSNAKWKHARYKNLFDSFMWSVGQTKVFVLSGELANGKRRKKVYTSHRAAKQDGWEKVK